MSSKYYTKEFYEAHRSGAIRSAEVMVPLVLQLLPARSVVDVGCGDGNWLSVFRKYGAEEILGVDGQYVDQGLLQIPKDCFRAVDLTKPFGLGRVFDLAVSLEVAEHLPVESGPDFVESLVRLAPSVLFSAAIPFQPGDNHINTEWPDKWAGLFERRGYVAIDFIRNQVWQNESVEWWYAQNTLLFARASLLDSSAALKAEFERTNRDQLSLVHPRHYLYLQEHHQEALMQARRLSPPSGVRAASRQLLICMKNAFRKRINSLGRKG